MPRGGGWALARGVSRRAWAWGQGVSRCGRIGELSPAAVGQSSWMTRVGTGAGSVGGGGGVAPGASTADGAVGAVPAVVAVDGAGWAAGGVCWCGVDSGGATGVAGAAGAATSRSLAGRGCRAAERSLVAWPGDWRLVRALGSAGMRRSLASRRRARATLRRRVISAEVSPLVSARNCSAWSRACWMTRLVWMVSWRSSR